MLFWWGVRVEERVEERGEERGEERVELDAFAAPLTLRECVDPID